MLGVKNRATCASSVQGPRQKRIRMDPGVARKRRVYPGRNVAGAWGETILRSRAFVNQRAGKISAHAAVQSGKRIPGSDLARDLPRYGGAASPVLEQEESNW